MPWNMIFVLAVVVVVTLVGARNYRQPRSSWASGLTYAVDEELFLKCVDELPPVYESYPTHPPVVSFENYDPKHRSDVLDLACDACGTAIVEGDATVVNSEGCLAHRTCPGPEVYEYVYEDVLPKSRRPPPDTSWVTTETVKW